MVQYLLKEYAVMVQQACKDVTQLIRVIQWIWNLTKSPYQPKKNSVFLVDIAFDRNGFSYSTDSERFEEAVVTLFSKSVNRLKKIPQLEKMVMENSFCTGQRTCCKYFEFL